MGRAAWRGRRSVFTSAGTSSSVAAFFALSLAVSVLLLRKRSSLLARTTLKLPRAVRFGGDVYVKLCSKHRVNERLSPRRIFWFCVRVCGSVPECVPAASLSSSEPYRRSLGRVFVHYLISCNTRSTGG